MRVFALLVAASALFAGCERAEPKARFTSPQRLGGVEVQAEVLEQGAMLYGRYCASCHGVDGDGQGPAAASLAEAPRDFRRAEFRYASAAPRELPSHEALKEIIAAGIPAKGMPPWRGLRDEDLSALAFYIKTFSPRWSDVPAAPAKPAP